MEGSDGITITRCYVVISDDADVTRVLGYASVTFNECFIVHDVKIVSGRKGVFVAMPSRRIRVCCQNCGRRISIEGSFCIFCGVSIQQMKTAMRRMDPSNAGLSEEDIRHSAYADVCHPVRDTFRKYLSDVVMEEYRIELELSKLPGYQPRWTLNKKT